MGFWRVHIPEYSQIVSPLYHVTQEKNYLQGGLEEQGALKQIKQEIVDSVVLKPVRTGQGDKNVLYTTARKNGPSGAPGTRYLEDLRTIPVVLEPGTQRI